MRIAVRSYQAPNEPPVPVHSVAVTLSPDTHANQKLRGAEARAVGGLVNDPAFQAAVIDGLKTVGEEILERVAPGSTDAFAGSQYVAISTDLESLSFSWQKGDRINLVEQFSDVTAEVVDVVSSGLPHGQVVKTVTTVFKVTIPIVAAALRFQKARVHPGAIEGALLEAHASKIASETPPRPVTSIQMPSLQFFEPNPEIRKIFTNKLSVILNSIDRET